MTSYIDVSFNGLVQDPSVESAIHRWVARFEAMRIEVRWAGITVEPSGRRRTLVCLTMALTDGTVRTAATIHTDVYVAVADAFRAVRQQTLQPAPARGPSTARAMLRTA